MQDDKNDSSDRTDLGVSDTQGLVGSDSVTPITPAPEPVVPPRQKSSKVLWIVIAVLVALLLGAVGYGLWRSHHRTAALVYPLDRSPDSWPVDPNAPYVKGVMVTTKNYGNKYANGILPVGDGKYVTSTTKPGYIYACAQYAQSLTASKGGAGTRGPWFTNNNTQYDINKKAHVAGSVMWAADFSNTASGGTRTIVTNDLPTHPTGVFPIQASDPAHAYDRNPNSIKGQTLTYALPSSPVYENIPHCMNSGEAGVMLTGAALFNAFDAGGRDAGAWEVQDSCSGHPQVEGEYHYHTLSSCIKNADIHTVIGYALDGYPITGPKVGDNNILTTADLDVCHGIGSTVTIDGKSMATYHYVMTEDFPYSVSCFRGTPINPPGMQQSPPTHP
jgi:hypothetical protein